MRRPPTRRNARTTNGALPRIGQGSLTEQTTQALLKAILDRQFPNDRLPNEPELAERMGVSRTTIRAALHTLDKLGVISRTPGRGTQLRPHVGPDCMLLHRLIGFRGMLEAHYRDVHTSETFTVRDHGSEAAIAALGVDDKTQMVVNDKTYIADGHPAVHLLQEIPLEYVSDDLAKKLVRGRKLDPPATIFEFSMDWPGREIDHSVVDVVPGIVPKNEPFPLDMEPGTAYLALHEVHYTEMNEPVAYGQEIVDDQFVRLRLIRTS